MNERANTGAEGGASTGSSTIAHFIHRFRHAKPSSPDQRRRVRGDAEEMFWWHAQRSQHGDNVPSDAARASPAEPPAVRHHAPPSAHVATSYERSRGPSITSVQRMRVPLSALRVIGTPAAVTPPAQRAECAASSRWSLERSGSGWDAPGAPPSRAGGVSVGTTELQHPTTPPLRVVRERGGAGVAAAGEDEAAPRLTRPPAPAARPAVPQPLAPVVLAPSAPVSLPPTLGSDDGTAAARALFAWPPQSCAPRAAHSATVPAVTAAAANTAADGTMASATTASGSGVLYVPPAQVQREDVEVRASQRCRLVSRSRRCHAPARPRKPFSGCVDDWDWTPLPLLTAPRHLEPSRHRPRRV